MQIFSGYLFFGCKLVDIYLSLCFIVVALRYCHADDVPRVYNSHLLKREGMYQMKQSYIKISMVRLLNSYDFKLWQWYEGIHFCFCYLVKVFEIATIHRL